MSVRIVMYSFLILGNLYNLFKYWGSGTICSMLGVFFFTGLLIDEIRFLRNWNKKQKEIQEEE